MTQWFALVNEETGEALSFASVIADELPDGVLTVEIDHQPEIGERWNPETRAVEVAPGAPDVDEFYRGVYVALGGDVAAASRMYRIDREYPGIERNLRLATWDMALAGIAALLLDEVITEQEHTAIQAAWDAANLGRPA